MTIELLAMEDFLWETIKKSKNEELYLSTEKQYENLVNILSGYDKETVQVLENVWREKTGEIVNHSDYHRFLHDENCDGDCNEFLCGGLLSHAGDTYFIDFPNWILAQGKRLFDQFQEHGHVAILDYIREHSVSKNDYRFECMAYAFYPYMDDSL